MCVCWERGENGLFVVKLLVCKYARHLLGAMAIE